MFNEKIISIDLIKKISVEHFGLFCYVSRKMSTKKKKETQNKRY